jgi:hypothetical protein
MIGPVVVYVVVESKQVVLEVGSAGATRYTERRTISVARISKAASFTLVIANTLFAALGLALTGKAIVAAGGHRQEIRARLSIAGLVAD